LEKGNEGIFHTKMLLELSTEKQMIIKIPLNPPFQRGASLSRHSFSIAGDRLVGEGHGWSGAEFRDVMAIILL